MAETSSASSAGAAPLGVSLPLPQITHLFFPSVQFKLLPKLNAEVNQSVIEDLDIEASVVGLEHEPLKRSVFVQVGLDAEKNPLSPYEFRIMALAHVDFEMLDLKLDEQSLAVPTDELSRHAGLLVGPALLASIREQVTVLTSRTPGPVLHLPLFPVSRLRQILRTEPLMKSPPTESLSS